MDSFACTALDACSLQCCGRLMKERPRPTARGMRAWPLVAVSSLVAAVIAFMLSANDLITRMGNMIGWSVAFFLATISSRW